MDGSCLGLGTEAGDAWGLPLTSESVPRQMLNHEWELARKLYSQIFIINLSTKLV